jgi:hypothetical protein
LVTASAAYGRRRRTAHHPTAVRPRLRRQRRASGPTSSRVVGRPADCRRSRGGAGRGPAPAPARARARCRGADRCRVEPHPVVAVERVAAVADGQLPATATFFEVFDDRGRVFTRPLVTQVTGDRVGGPLALGDPPTGQAADALGESPSAAQQEQLGRADAAPQPIGNLDDRAILEVVGAQRTGFSLREAGEGDGEVDCTIRWFAGLDGHRFEHSAHPIPMRPPRGDAQRHAPDPGVRDVVRGDLVPSRVRSDEGLLGDVFSGGADQPPNGAGDPTELDSIELDKVDCDAAGDHDQVSPPTAARRTEFRFVVSRPVGGAPRRAARSTVSSSRRRRAGTCCGT